MQKFLRSILRGKHWNASGASRLPAPTVNFQKLVESGLDVVHQVRVRPGGWTVEYASPSTPEVLGWSCEEALRLRPDELFAEWSMPLAIANLERLIRDGSVSIATLQAKHKDGSLVWMDFRVRLLCRHEGDEATVIVAGRDVSEFKRLEAQLADLVLVDALTGIGNRRAFDAAIQREWKEAVASGRPLSLVMVDVDHFKQVNDTYGHQVGDACLQAIAEAFRRMLQHTRAFPARYGGEELAVLLPDTSAEMATALAERLRVAVSAMTFPTQQDYGALTVSCGVSTVPMPPCAPDGMPARLVTAADCALYEAKRQGRDRVITHCLPLHDAFALDQETPEGVDRFFLDQARTGSGISPGTRSRSQW